MCAIAGFSGTFPGDLLERMGAVLAHRGPDDAGVYFDPVRGIGLAHRRLSIIDLSPAGHQPMHDPERQVTIVFNGEIYNFAALRAELIRAGVAFRGHSDTEVLLHLYLREGQAMLPRLNGIFAFAIWDRRDDTLFIARDGLGTKPLYYAQTREGFLFASELKALLACASVPDTLNHRALALHLTYLWCPAPDTILQEVKKLEPGHAMLIRNGKVARAWCYYDLPYRQAIQNLDDGAAAAELTRLLDRAVQRQMVADVPVGAFLSGGLDSSAIVALARRRTSSGQLDCFTIDFSGVHGEPGLVEDLPYAQRVARHLGVKLHTVSVDSRMVSEMATMIFHLDEPLADLAPLNALFISRLARAQGIKVLLSGTGGDDIFTGYRRHLALMRESYWSWLPQPVRQTMANAAQALPQRFAATRRLGKALQFAGETATARLAGYFCWLDPSAVLGLLHPQVRDSLTAQDIALPLLEKLQMLPPQTPAINQMLYLEGKFFLADHNLNYMDKVSMACGVEVRVPLLDVDLVEFAARLQPTQKQRGAEGKWIFKKAMEPYLPREVIYRPKTGFTVPLARWIRNELAPLVDDLLSPTALRQRGLFDVEAVRQLVAANIRGSREASYSILSLMCIEMWCRLFIDGRSAKASNLKQVAAR